MESFCKCTFFDNPVCLLLHYAAHSLLRKHNLVFLQIGDFPAIYSIHIQNKQTAPPLFSTELIQDETASYLL